MKLLLATALLAFAPLAHASSLDIVNNSPLRADIGEWRGIKVPSICEDFKPCWVEVNQTFHPTPGLSDIRGEKLVQLKAGVVTKMYVDGGQRGTYDILESCSSVEPDDLVFFYQLGGEAHLKDIQELSICLSAPSAKLIID